jgi:hypothetical protein
MIMMRKRILRFYPVPVVISKYPFDFALRQGIAYCFRDFGTDLMQ